MKVLVTGVAGYIGSICAEVLVRSGYTVIGVDDLSEGHRAAIPPEVEFWECNLADRKELDRLFESHSIDAVMHFAAKIEVEKSVQTPSAFYFTNIACGLHLLDAMLRHRVKRLIFSSTAAVYGEPQTVPISEDHSRLPVNPYGHTKLHFEQILEELRAAASLQHVCLRYFNAAGASTERGEHHRSETHLVPRLLEVALGQREHIQMNGDDYPTPDGTCIRDYIHVLDIAGAHLLALEKIERVAGESFNLGSSRGYSVKEVLDAARKVTGKPIPTLLAPRRTGDSAVLVASSEKARGELGWEPRHSSLEEILESAWAWKQKHPRGYA